VVAIVLTLVAAASGCTGSGGSTTTTRPEQTASGAATTNVLTIPTGTEPTAPPAPNAGGALELFVQAAGRRDVAGMWALLSTPTQRRFGGDSETFAARYAAEFEQGIGSFAATDHRIVLALRPVAGWAVAAIAGVRESGGNGQTAAYATALRREGGRWRLEIGGPVDVVPVVPSTGLEAGTNPQLGMRVHAPQAIDKAAIWIDGDPLPTLAAGPNAETLLVAGKPSRPLARGTHFGIGFALAGDQATALAWPLRAE